MATHSSTLAGKSHGRRRLVGCSPWGRQSRTRLSDFTFTIHFQHWRRKWQPTPVFLPGESQGRRSLVGCRLWGRTESDTTEATQQQQQQQVFLFLGFFFGLQLFYNVLLVSAVQQSESAIVKVKQLSPVRLFATPWTVAYQVPPSMGVSRQEYWSGLPFLLQEIFPTQGLNPRLLHWQVDSLPQSPQGGPHQH